MESHFICGSFIYCFYKKFHWHVATVLHFPAVHGCFHTTGVDLSSCDRDREAQSLKDLPTWLFQRGLRLAGDTRACHLVYSHPAALRHVADPWGAPVGREPSCAPRAAVPLDTSGLRDTFCQCFTSTANSVGSELHFLLDGSRHTMKAP